MESRSFAGCIRMSSRALLLAVTFLLAITSSLPAQPPSGAPEWHPLPPDQQAYLDQVLNYWEHVASKIQRYRCKFTRHEYDPTTFSRQSDQKVASVISQGSIQFSAPDKGLFKVESVLQAAVEQVPVAGNRTIA